MRNRLCKKCTSLPTNNFRFARTIDAAWFNERDLPKSFFEVENTTDMIAMEVCEWKSHNIKSVVVFSCMLLSPPFCATFVKGD